MRFTAGGLAERRPHGLQLARLGDILRLSVRAGLHDALPSGSDEAEIRREMIPRMEEFALTEEKLAELITLYSVLKEPRNREPLGDVHLAILID